MKLLLEICTLACVIFVFTVPVASKNIELVASSPLVPKSCSLLATISSDERQQLNDVFWATAIDGKLSVEDVKCHLERGGDINSSYMGLTALHEVAIHDQQDVVKCLIENGADINAQDLFGNTPLLHAASLGRLGAARILIEHGANPNKPNFLDQFPLDKMMLGDIHFTKLLQNAGAKGSSKPKYFSQV